MQRNCRYRVDVDKLYAAIDKERRKKRLSWHYLSQLIGVADGTFSRMGLDGKTPSADSLATMCAWLDIDLRDFIVDRWAPVLPDGAYSLNEQFAKGVWSWEK